MRLFSFIAMLALLTAEVWGRGVGMDAVKGLAGTRGRPRRRALPGRADGQRPSAVRVRDRVAGGVRRRELVEKVGRAAFVMKGH